MSEKIQVAKPVKKKKTYLMMHGEEGGRYMTNEEIDLFVQRTKDNAIEENMGFGFCAGAIFIAIIWFLTFLVSHLHWVS